MTTMTMPVSTQRPYQVREHPVAMIAILAGATCAVGTGAVLTSMGTAPGLVPVVLGISAAITAVLTLIFTTLNLRVDANGLRVSWGGVFFKTLRREEIVRAEVGPYTWSRFGGWGMRFSLKRDMAFSYPRNKGALIVHRANGRQLVITLQDPGAAAAAVNGLLKATPAAAR